MAAAVKAPQRLLDDRSSASELRAAPIRSNVAPPGHEGVFQEARSLAPAVQSGSKSELPTTIAIGGHRGMGMNRRDPNVGLCTGAFRENTVRSLCEAASNGASFVEFDVQVTKDGVPVIWHDDFATVRDSDGALKRRKIGDLALAEFKQLHRQQLVRECDGGAEVLEWKCDADHELPTLDEVFRGVPESVGFDIEVKMTTPDSELRTPEAEVERMVTAILKDVREWEALTYRRIVFSTFDPDVAVALKRRQTSIPVLFLSDGMTDYADPRRCGLTTAVALAARHSLDGVVFEIEALAMNPSLTATARQLGLHVLTYGIQNNNPNRVREQQEWGVHAAIVDDVENVVRGLADASRGHLQASKALVSV